MTKQSSAGGTPAETVIRQGRPGRKRGTDSWSALSILCINSNWHALDETEEDQTEKSTAEG